MIGPESESISLEEGVSKRIKKVIRSECLELRLDCSVLIRHDWWGNWWSNFSFVFREEKTFDSEFEILRVNLRG